MAVCEALFHSPAPIRYVGTYFATDVCKAALVRFRFLQFKGPRSRTAFLRHTFSSPLSV